MRLRIFTTCSGSLDSDSEVKPRISEKKIVRTFRSPAEDHPSRRLNHVKGRLRNEFLHVGSLPKSLRHLVERFRKIANLVTVRHLELEIEVACLHLTRTLYQRSHRSDEVAGQHGASSNADRDGDQSKH